MSIKNWRTLEETISARTKVWNFRIKIPLYKN
jgi:hypothetical protein